MQLSSYPNALYQWSAQDRFNKNMYPSERRILLPFTSRRTISLLVADQGLVTAQKLQKIPRYPGPLFSSGYDRHEYHLSLTVRPNTAKELCLNACSYNGMCITDLSESELPHCQCFEGFTGADCGISVLKHAPTDAIDVSLWQDSSVLVVLDDLTTARWLFTP